jgi:hypothetical protein
MNLRFVFHSGPSQIGMVVTWLGLVFLLGEGLGWVRAGHCVNLASSPG